MALANNLRGQVSALTADLISCGLSSDQNFPTLTNLGGCHSISFSGEEDISITLKNVHYSELYSELKAKRQFNIQLLDGALLQLQYLIKGEEILKHRLAFFPSPDLSEYQNNAEIYETDEIYADVIAKNIVTSPIRFDFDRSNFKEDIHPMSHLTIGQYKNCRIAVGGPLSPSVFMQFILRSFYNTASIMHSQKIRTYIYDFPLSITELERKALHIMMPA